MSKAQNDYNTKVPDCDIWATAKSLIKYIGCLAEVHATAQYQAMLDRRDCEGMAVWNRIRCVLKELLAEPEDGSVH